MRGGQRRTTRGRQACAKALDSRLATIQAHTVALRHLANTHGLPHFVSRLARIEEATDAAERELLALDPGPLRNSTADAVRRLSATQTRKTPAGTGATSKTTRAGDTHELSG